MKHSHFYISLVLICFSPLCLLAENWPQFRGPNASGVALGSNPPAKIGPTEGVAWSVEVPWSPSSPCIWGERIFLTTFNAEELETRCYNRADGKLLWARAIKPDGVELFHRLDGSPAASTPATDGQHVVSYFGSFGVVCYDFSGKELWNHPLELALSPGKYGSGTSPIIAGDRVVINRDQHRFSTLLSLDVKTGKKIWETPRPDSSGSFGTPVLWHNNGVDEIVLGAVGRLKGYDLRTGSERWLLENITGYVCTTPVIANGMLYFAAWSNQSVESAVPPWDEFYKNNDKNGDGVVSFDEIDDARIDYWRGVDFNRDNQFSEDDWTNVKARSSRYENTLVAIKSGGIGNITETHLAWRYRKGLPYVPSLLHYEDRLYFIKDLGILTSLDAETGEPHYAQTRLPEASGSYYASPVAANGQIYLASVSGILTVVKSGGAKPEILHQVDFGERILASPAIVGDSIYLRTDKRLWAFGK